MAEFWRASSSDPSSRRTIALLMIDFFSLGGRGVRLQIRFGDLPTSLHPLPRSFLEAVAVRLLVDPCRAPHNGCSWPLRDDLTCPPSLVRGLLRLLLRLVLGFLLRLFIRLLLRVVLA